MTRRRERPADAPLLAWGEALRVARLRRRRLARRGAAIATGVAALAATMAFPPAPRLVWNASASAPIGFYLVDPAGRPGVGDTVIARVPARWRSLGANRHYLPLNVPLVKRVAAAGGDEVCALGAQIFVDGEPVAERRRTDGGGRAMPWWDGCRRLGGDQFFLLMADRSDSFDGRYFGPTDRADIIGMARSVGAAR